MGKREISTKNDEPAGRAPRFNRQSSSYARVGRTIGEARERLETANERAAARKKDKRKNATRITMVSIGFAVLVVVLVVLAVIFLDQDRGSSPVTTEPTVASSAPTIEVVDEDASATGGKITGRMHDYIGMAEADFKSIGLSPVKAVLPTGTIREVDFYLADQPGFIKMAIDRDPAVSVEDADRMLRYLAAQGVTTFEYIDVRLSGRAYWK